MDKQILFFDNEHDNWEKTKKTGEIEKDMALHSDKVSFIPVDDTRPNNLVSSINISGLTNKQIKNAYNMAYLQHFLAFGNTYAIYINNVIDFNKDQPIKIQDPYLDKDYVNNGITQEQIGIINNWLYNNPDKVAIFFDWDRTITCVEGMVINKGIEMNALLTSLNNGSVTYDDLLVFLMGGTERLQMIKDMFKNIIESGTNFFILTHNPYAAIRTYTREIYKNLLMMLTGYDKNKVDDLLYSSINYGNKKAKSACYINMEISKLLKDVCKTIIDEAFANKLIGKAIAYRNLNNETVIKGRTKKGGKRSKKRKTKKRKTRKYKY